MTGLSRPLYLLHHGEQRVVIGRTVYARMHASMAVRTQRDHKMGVVGSAIASSANVMRFKVTRAILPQERRRATAAFANGLGTCEDVVPNVGGALINCPHCSSAWLGRCSRSHGKRAQVREIVGGRIRRALNDRLILYHIGDHIERPKLKHDCLSRIACTVWRSLPVPAFADHLVDQADHPGRTFLAKKKDVFSVGGMIGDGFVAVRHGHVPSQAFAKVFDPSIAMEPIPITVGVPSFISHNEDDVVLLRRDDAALALTAETTVNVSPPVIRLSLLKAPNHLILPRVKSL